MFWYHHFYVILNAVPLTVPYAYFFLYGDRDHDGIIDHQDINAIRNPAWITEWHSFGMNEFLPVDEFEFEIFIAGKL